MARRKEIVYKGRWLIEGQEGYKTTAEVIEYYKQKDSLERQKAGKDIPASGVVRCA